MFTYIHTLSSDWKRSLWPSKYFDQVSVCLHVPFLRWSLQFFVRVFPFLFPLFCVTRTWALSFPRGPQYNTYTHPWHLLLLIDTHHPAKWVTLLPLTAVKHSPKAKSAVRVVFRAHTSDFGGRFFTPKQGKKKSIHICSLMVISSMACMFSWH